MKSALTAVIACGLLGCGESSKLEPDSKVSVRGKAFRSDGAALMTSDVLLVKEPDLGEVLAGFTAVASTIGLACLSPEPPALCESARRSKTDSAGSFSFSLEGEDTQGSVGQASTFNLSARGPGRQGAVAGPARTERFTIQQTELNTPDLKLWEPALTLSLDASKAVLTFSALAPGATGARILFAAGPINIWEQPYESGEEIDVRLLEDTQGGASVSSTVAETHAGTPYQHIYESEARPFQGTAGGPPSRSAACSAVGASGVAVALTPCPVTDGELVQPFVAPPDSGCQPDDQGKGCETARADRSLTVDLGSVRSATLLVVRGLSDREVVERSENGTLWSPVTMDGLRANFSPAIPLRYLRLRAKDGEALSSLVREISIW